MQTIYYTIDQLIQARVLYYLERFGKDAYDVCKNPIIKRIQMEQPRCIVGCPCLASRVWRTKATQKLNELDSKEE